MPLIRRPGGYSETGKANGAPAAGDASKEAAIATGADDGRLTNRQSSKQCRTERLIALALLGSGAVAFTADSLTGAVLLGTIGASLYVHSRFIALWTDDG